MHESERLQKFSADLQYEYLLGTKYPEMEVRESSIHQEGIYTKEDIRSGQVLFPLVGMVYRMSDAKIDYPKYSYQISDTEAVETENEPGFINHSCNPNCYLAEDWTFQATRDIKEGEEITIDYGTVDYFDYSFECGCGSSNCRGTFSGLISANLDYQKEKSDIFSPYLKNKFHLVAPEVFRQRMLVDITTDTSLTKTAVEEFLTGIVKHLRLISYGGPMVYETGGQGKAVNQGYDGFIALVDSGISISTWRDSGLVSVYVHTCKEFKEEDALTFIDDYFKPINRQVKRL